MSLMGSLINHYFIVINTLPGKRGQTIVFDQIDFPMYPFTEMNHHPADVHQRQTIAIRIGDKQIYIAIRSLLPT